jgi:hypothetical protein
MKKVGNFLILYIHVELSIVTSWPETFMNKYSNKTNINHTDLNDLCIRYKTQHTDTQTTT